MACTDAVVKGLVVRRPPDQSWAAVRHKRPRTFDSRKMPPGPTGAGRSASAGSQHEIGHGQAGGSWYADFEIGLSIAIDVAAQHPAGKAQLTGDPGERASTDERE